MRSFENEALANQSEEYVPRYFVLCKQPWLKFIIYLSFMLQGLVGAFFIKANLWYCKVRKTSKLGKYPITEVSFALISLLPYCENWNN